MLIVEYNLVSPSEDNIHMLKVNTHTSAWHM